MIAEGGHGMRHGQKINASRDILGSACIRLPGKWFAKMGSQ